MTFVALRLFHRAAAGPTGSPLRGWLCRALLALAFALALPAQADNNVEVLGLETRRDESGLQLDFSLRVTLSRAVEDALTRGVPVYFVARADVYKPRWYWRDDRVARTSRSWRVSYQPLTGNYRVGLGGLSQSYDTLGDAMLAVTRLAGWQIAEPGQLDPESRHYVDFSWRLDTTQLPRPLQIGSLGQSDWALDVERRLRLEPQQ